MSYVSKTLRNAAIGVAVADDCAALKTFLAPGCAAAIWRRQVPSDIQNWLDAISPDMLPRGRVIVQPRAIPDALETLCNTANVPEGTQRDWLCADITTLADTFANLMNTPWLRLRLDVVTTNACRKFHIDALSGRMVCTYRGTGTQYGISTDGDDPKRVYTVPTGAPILLRGTLWPTQPPSGLLHRSPPIEGTGETRLVLVLDPIHDPDEEI